MNKCTPWYNLWNLMANVKNIIRRRIKTAIILMQKYIGDDDTVENYIFQCCDCNSSDAK